MNEKLKKRYKTIFHSLITKINRPGSEKLILKYKELLTSPASINHHLNCEGGLMVHSVNVYLKFKKRLLELKENIPEESIIISCLLHDLCKVGAYIKTENGYIYNKEHPEGHAKLSIERIKEFIDLEPIEEDLIRFHMGIFGMTGKYAEYTTNDLLYTTQRSYLVQVFASCDMECSREEDFF